MGPREEIPEIPTDAVREILINAYAHRDWLSSGCVQIDIYNDSVEVFNPGWFIEGQDLEAHLSGKSRSSLTRNELIARTLYRSKEKEHTPMDQYCADRGVFIIENLCNLSGVLKNGNTFIANTYPMNYAEMTGLPCRVVVDI